MATGKIRIDYDSPSPNLVLDATNDFDDGITVIVAAFNAQITAQNAIEAAKTPPGPVTPPQTRNGYIASLITPIVDSTARSIRETSVKAGIDKLQAATKAQRQAFMPAGASNPFHVAASNPGTPASAIVGVSGSVGDRLAEVTASARSLPALANGRIVVRFAKVMVTCPPTRSVTAGLPPL